MLPEIEAFDSSVFDYEDTTLSPPIAKSTLASDRATKCLHDDLPEVLSAVLPGHGEPGASCGQPVPYHCNDDDRSFWTYSSCMLRVCPYCFEKWAFKEANAASWRVWQGMEYLYWQYVINARLMHIVVSIRWDGQTLQECRNKVMWVLKDHGVDGGLLVFHPFRKDKETNQYHNDGTVHFHCLVAVVDTVAGGSEQEYADGTFFKIIPNMDGDFNGIQSLENAKRAVAYLLSHCGLIEGKHSVTWFGSMAYNKLSTKAIEATYGGAPEPPQKECPYCHGHNTESCYGYDYFQGGQFLVHPLPDEPMPDSPIRKRE